MKFISLFNLENWMLSDRYQPLQKILRADDGFLWMPLKNKEVKLGFQSHQDENVKQNRRHYYPQMFNNIDLIESEKFFLIFNNRLYLCNNNLLYVTKTHINREDLAFNGEDKMTIKNIVDVNKTIHYTDAYQKLEKKDPDDENEEIKYRRTLGKNIEETEIKTKIDLLNGSTEFGENGLIKLYYSDGENDWFSIIGKYLEDSLYWGKFKTYFLMKILRFQIRLQKIKNKRANLRSNTKTI